MRLFSVSLFAISMFFVTATSIQAATIYINSATGNDTTGNGTSGAPYKTFTKGYTVAAANDTLNLTGTFDWSNPEETGVGSQGYQIFKALTITGQGAAKTFIQGAPAPNTDTDKRNLFYVVADMTFNNIALRYSYGDVSCSGGTAIWNLSGTVTLNNVWIYGNSSAQYSSCSTLDGGNFTISSSTISDNHHQGGAGAISVGNSSTLKITNSTIYGNTGYSSDAGAIYANRNSAKITLTNTTILNNSGPQVYLVDSTNSQSASTSIKNTIIANSISGNDITYYSTGAQITNNGYNIIRVQSGSKFTNGVNGNKVGTAVVSSSTLDIVGTTLKFNGNIFGVPTLAIGSSSIAVNAGHSATGNAGVAIPSTDQRSFARSSTTDIGAFEYGSGTPDTDAPSITFSSPSNGGSVSGTTTITASVTDATGVIDVLFYINGTLRSTDTESAYSYDWDTTTLPNGSATIMVVARDYWDNSATSTITVSIANPEPTVHASNVTFSSVAQTEATVSWTNGDGTSRVVFAKSGSTGTSSPVNGTTYTANSAFGSGTQIGSSGWYTVYNGTSTSVTVTSLSPNSPYVFHVVEYTGSTGVQNYLTSSTSTNPASTSTLPYPVPSTQASSIVFSGVEQAQATLSWTNGDGTSRIVFASATTTGTASPVDATSYTANSAFGSGTQIGSTGWYAVYSGTGTSTTVTSLLPSTEYRFHVIEYMGSGGSLRYLTSSASSNPSGTTTIAYTAPTVHATNVAMANVVATVSNGSSTISWTSGSGSNRIVFIKSGNSGTASPVDATSYTANSAFGSGSQIGSTGWYAVYKGTGSSTAVSNVRYDTDYQIHVIEYNGTAGYEKYLTSSTSTNPLTRSAYAGSTLYADASSGNDTTGNGTSGSPYKTITKAYSVAVDGDTINLTGTFDISNSDETADVSDHGFIWYKPIVITGQKAGDTIVQSSSTARTADRRIFTFQPPYGTSTLRNLTVRYGKASTSGCIYQITGMLHLQAVDINNCYSQSGSAGGLLHTTGTTTIENSSFRNNHSWRSGAIYSGGGAVIVKNSTITGNGAEISQGGGGIFLNGTSNLFLTNVTIRGNAAPAGGGLSYGINAPNVYIKNSIIAGNTASSSVNADVYKYSGTLNSQGYNIIGYTATSTFNATTGDYRDSGGGGTYVLYVASTTGTLSLGSEELDSTTGTYVHPLQTGSIGINAGTTTAHTALSVTVPISSTDQRGTARSGATDIGAYEYTGVVDSTAPVISSVASSTTTTTATITWTTDESANSRVNYGSTASYGTASTSSTLRTSHTMVLSGLTPGTAYHFQVQSADASSNTATSSDYIFTTATEDVDPTSVSVTAGTTTATITWTTAVAASSRVYFGPRTDAAYFTPETNTSPRVTSHSVSLSNLPRCGFFHYKVTGASAAGSRATSTLSTFKTLGCTGSTTISTSTASTITKASGGTITQDILRLTVPANFTSTSSSIIFQANKLDRSSFFTSVTPPTGKSAATTAVFNLQALVTATTTISTFDEPLDVTITYSDSEVSGLSESSLTIYRYDDGTWTALTNCTRDTSAKTVTCKTEHFSDFALMGESSSSSGSGSVSAGGGDLISDGSGNWRYATGQAYTAPNVPSTPQPSVFVSTTSPATLSFTKNLKLGMIDSEVLALQKFLNTRGYVISSEGPGSSGNETNKFGAFTLKALAKFQKDNGIIPASGYFGPLTRAHINSTASTSTSPRVPQTPPVPISPTSTTTIPIIDLELGSEGDDVKKLQELLISKGYSLPSGATGYFGAQTKAALIQFQKDNGIAPAAGYFGPMTRAKMGNH